MGFRPKRLPRKLDFSGTEYEGLEITTRPVPMSVMFDVTSTTVGATQSGDPTQPASAFRQLAATFAYALDSWNVEDDDGQPVPASLDGLMSQDPQFVNAVIDAWSASLTR